MPPAVADLAQAHLLDNNRCRAENTVSQGESPFCYVARAAMQCSDFGAGTEGLLLCC
jgi:hypothetical protein